MTVEEAAELLGLPLRYLELLTRNPNVARAIMDVNSGIGPEAAAARHDLPWIDPTGVDYAAIMRPVISPREHKPGKVNLICAPEPMMHLCCTGCGEVILAVEGEAWECDHDRPPTRVPAGAPGTGLPMDRAEIYIDHEPADLPF